MGLSNQVSHFFPVVYLSYSVYRTHVQTPSMSWLRRDTGFLVFSFPRSLGSGVYNRINGGQQKLVHIYLSYISTKSHPNRSKFGGNIAQINAHQLLLSFINSVINSTPQGPWERKGQKTRVTP